MSLLARNSGVAVSATIFSIISGLYRLSISGLSFRCFQGPGSTVARRNACFSWSYQVSISCSQAAIEGNRCLISSAALEACLATAKEPGQPGPIFWSWFFLRFLSVNEVAPDRAQDYKGQANGHLQELIFTEAFGQHDPATDLEDRPGMRGELLCVHGTSTLLPKWALRTPEISNILATSSNGLSMPPTTIWS